ncbi:helix-turn-helix transcriptional regulator [Ligilactobacillus salivarius]|uniref:HTH cro/C1-type domain-containing protein n=1 Tax=Ligilactobacillus salivarius TaxID=1624 RepID=A0A1Y0F7Q2_9LACO|nr:helix-turn-helix transcriptional regulator [Ligilactobacillus salivarius]ARU19382.1 hypothetical protein B7R82_05010 [Ligilactobacillus salivarius]
MNRIKELRKKRKLTLKQVSEDTNIPISTLSSYEKGDRQPKIDKIISLANYFDVPVSYLTGLYNTNKLDELLKQKNISKKQISEDLHIPLVKIVDYASNRKEIPVYDGIKISSYLNVSLDELQGSKNDTVDYYTQIRNIIVHLGKSELKELSKYIDKQLNNTSDETTDKK